MFYIYKPTTRTLIILSLKKLEFYLLSNPVKSDKKQVLIRIYEGQAECLHTPNK